MTDQWQNCYDDGWQGNIVPEAFSHPAKFSHGLIHRIYQHAKDMQWVMTGDYVLDPFAGVALGGLDAMGMGLNWIGVELEEKFVKLGEQNIELWNRQLKGWPNLGTARIIQGDSRRLRDVIKETSLIVSSPPYVECLTGGGQKHKEGFKQGQTQGRDAFKGGYSKDVIEKADLVVSSPPYSEIYQFSPYHQGVRSDYKNGKRKSQTPEGSYGQSPGQLGSMKEGNFDMCVSSPPYEGDVIKKRGYDRWAENKDSKGMAWGRRKDGIMITDAYGKSKDNLGNRVGDTFWSASKEIVQGCYELLKPGGHAIWVCKDYVKNKKRVPFSDRWLALCESVGFKLVCRHLAMLVKEHGTQITTHGDEKITTERKSFFRRLAESKGSPRIDWEGVICMVKI